MNTNDATRANAEAMPAAQATVPYPLQEPIDEIDVALGRLRVLYAALTADSQRLTGCSSLDAAMIVNEVLDTLNPIRTFLAENDFPKVETPFLECRREWYAKTAGSKEASLALSELVDKHAEITAAINSTDGDPDATETVALSKRQCDLALAICGYRPLSKPDEVRKAEFLRDWTAGGMLTEAEQKALIASMLPEGGAA